MRTFKELFQNEVDEKATPAQIMQNRRKMSRRMKLLAKKSSTKMKKKRARVKRRDPDALQAITKRQAKMMVIKRSLGPEVNYKELPMQKRIQIDQKIVAKKRKVIDIIEEVHNGVLENNSGKPMSDEFELQINKNLNKAVEAAGKIAINQLPSSNRMINIVKSGYDEKLVKRIYKLLLMSEYKRRQSAPGVKLTARSFGKERRYPITNAFTDDE